jgi:hypothetical protein
MSELSADKIWEAKLDGKFQCEVTRLGDYKGLLTVTNMETSEELLSEEVGLAYGAPFGPDVDDVAQWQDRVVQVVDAL